MGVIRSTESMEAEVEELQRMLGGGVADCVEWKRETGALRKSKAVRGPEDHGRMVCVTSGLSFLGFALVNHLLSCGYTVRLALETQEDLDKAREMEMFGEMGRDGVWAVVANIRSTDSLCEAFDGCNGVFHTSSFTDPSGVSGYNMAEIEAKVAEGVVEACVRTRSVRKCIFTSSLLACVWQQISPVNRRLSIDENCWSDESLCRNKKLWFALGKTMAEKAAWRAARGRDVKLATLCPALVTGPGFCRRNSTASIAYLKGAQEMFADNLLATVDVSKVAEAHVRVYEGMGSTACGRYICFDHIITRDEEAANLEQQLGVPNRISNQISTNFSTMFELSKRKLSRLMSASRRFPFVADCAQRFHHLPWPSPFYLLLRLLKEI